jgi:hypothetical protein
VSPTLGAGWTDNGGGSYTFSAAETTEYLTITTPITVGKFFTATMTGAGLTGDLFGWSTSGFGSGEPGRTSAVDATITAPSMEATGTLLRAFITGTAVTLTGLSVKEVSAPSITTIGSGSIKFIWADNRATQVLGQMAYIDSASDVIIYDIADSAAVSTTTGTFSVCWIDDFADRQLSDADLDLHANISNISPVNGSRNVRRDWSLYFEITDDINGLSSSDITLKVNGVTVSPTITSFGSGFDPGFSSGFGGEGFTVTFTPASSSGFRKEVKIEIIAVDGAGDPFSEVYTFTTATAVNTSPSATKAPSVIVFQDLSLSDTEDVYKGVNVNWLDESVLALYVDEDQARAAAEVKIGNGIYHRHTFSARVFDVDASSNNTQDIQKGDIITIDVDALGLVDQKCEVLGVQRTTTIDRIEYNLNLAFYVVWS